MNKKIQEFIKKYFSIYNLVIVGLIIIIIVSLIIIIKPQEGKRKQKTVDGVKVVTSKIKEDEKITEKEARKLTVKQFKRIGENINEGDLQVTLIQRSGEEYYYIVSPKNTIEIRIIGGEVTRINSVIVE